MAILHLMPGSKINREFSQAVAVDAASDVILIPYGARPTARLIGFDGAGRSVQYSTSPEASIWAGTAVWSDWPDGAVVGDGIGRLTGAVTALRLSPTGGAGTWEVVG